MYDAWGKQSLGFGGEEARRGGVRRVAFAGDTQEIRLSAPPPPFFPIDDYDNSGQEKPKEDKQLLQLPALHGGFYQ